MGVCPVLDQGSPGCFPLGLVGKLLSLFDHASRRVLFVTFLDLVEEVHVCVVGVTQANAGREARRSFL